MRREFGSLSSSIGWRGTALQTWT